MIATPPQLGLTRAKSAHALYKYERNRLFYSLENTISINHYLLFYLELFLHFVINFIFLLVYFNPSTIPPYVTIDITCRSEHTVLKAVDSRSMKLMTLSMEAEQMINKYSDSNQAPVVSFFVIMACFR